MMPQGMSLPPPDIAAAVSSAVAQAIQAAGFATTDALNAVAASVPGAATAAPPGVAVAGAKGTNVKYALADHTHATSVQRTKLTVASAGTAIRWTFNNAYAAGTTPVCTATVENVSGATLPYVVNLVGPPTNTYADFIVFKAQNQTLGGTLIAIAGTVISLFTFAPAGVTLNCQAALPTQ